MLQLLPELSEIQLDEVVTGLALTVKESKGKGSRKSVLLNTIRRYITSEDVEDEEDQGLAMLGKLHEDLEQKLSSKKEDLEIESKEMQTELEEKLAKIKRDVRAEMEKEGAGGSGINITRDALDELLKRDAWNRTDTTIDKTRLESLLSKPTISVTEGNSNPKVDLHKFKIKEFKINGTVGGENETDYSGLMYQVKEGRKLGYTEDEIQLGIVKVIKDKTLKKYFEISTELSKDDFYGMLKNHYDVKDSTTLLEDLAASVQEPNETVLKFVMRMFNIRNTILQVTREEDCPLGESLVKKKFVHSVLVGLRKPTNRLQLQSLFGRSELTDMEFLKEVKEIMKTDMENEKKMGKAGKSVSTLDVDVKDVSTKATDGKVIADAVLEQISNLTAQMNAFATAVRLLQQEIESVKQLVLKGDGNNDSGKKENTTTGGNPYRNKRFNKCEKCAKTGAFCMHCSECGLGDHKRKDCPKNM